MYDVFTSTAAGSSNVALQMYITYYYAFHLISHAINYWTTPVAIENDIC